MTAQEKANEMGCRLIALAQAMPEDSPLQIALCECGGVQPYVVWLFNTAQGCFIDGDYCYTLARAVEAYDRRLMQYRARRIALV
jgi:hypothetical protein